jgi:hypothetical protein
MAGGRRPTHVITIQPKDSKVRTKAGVAWMNDKGWLSLTLRPGIVLDYRLNADHYISLYPILEEGDRPPKSSGSLMPDDGFDGHPRDFDDFDNDIPF